MGNEVGPGGWHACLGRRYALALGTPYILVLFGIALHGICFDFLAAGFIYVDNESPRIFGQVPRARSGS